MRRIEVPTETPTEFELGDTAADIQRRREEREQRDQREQIEKQQREEREGARRVETPHSHTEEGVVEKRPGTERHEGEIDAEGGGETATSQSRHKKGCMTNIYLTDTDDYAIVDFVQDHEELYDKIKEHFWSKAINQDHPWERFASSCKLSVNVCMTWLEFQRIRYGIPTRSKPGQARKVMTEGHN